MTAPEPVLRLLANQNYTAILRPLQWLVIALIFLFFLRVVRAVWVEVGPAPADPGRAAPRTTGGACGRPARPSGASSCFLQIYLKLVPGYQGQRYGVPDEELTIGRSPGCGIPTTYDVYSSTLHARLFRRRDQLWLEDLGSTNGTYLNSERLAQPRASAKVIWSRSERPSSR